MVSLNSKPKALILLGLFVVLFMGLPFFPETGSAQTDRRVAAVTIETILEAPETREDTGPVVMEVRIEDGEFAGRLVQTEEHQYGHYWYDLPFQEGSQYAAQLQVREGKLQRVIIEQTRSAWKLLIIFAIVTLVLVAVGRWEGFVGLLSTLFTLGMVYYFFIPVTLNRTTILLAGLVVCVATVLVTVPLVMRGAQATWPAVGSLLVVLFLSTLTTIWGLDWLNLDATQAHHSRLLLTHMNRAQGLSMNNLWQLVTIGIVLGTLGAIMDVSVVISSTIDEITRDLTQPNFIDAFQGGMNVGREILSTMANTLIFAYMGMFIPYLLAVEVFDLAWVYLLNIDFVGIEILRVFIALISMALIVPITSLLGATWSTKVLKR